MRVRGALTAAVLCAGCSFPEFAFVERDGASSDVATDALDDGTFESATDDGASNDADSSLATDAPLDATNEAASDTASPRDSASEAASDSAVETGDAAKDTASDVLADTKPLADTGKDSAPVDAGPTGCKAAHVFCDDFDSSTTPDEKWAGYFTAGGGTIELDKTGLCHTAPNAFLATVPSSVGGDAMPEIAANVNKQFDGPLPSTPMRIDFWFRVEGEFLGSSGVMIAKLQRGTAGRGVELGVGAGGYYVALLGSGTYKSFPAVAPISPGVFVHLRLEALLATDTTGWVKLYVDDMSTPALAKSGYSTSDTNSLTTRLLIGLYANDPNPSSYAARYDDVAFDWL